jgi:hypothetical protein
MNEKISQYNNIGMTGWWRAERYCRDRKASNDSKEKPLVHNMTSHSSKSTDTN